MLVTFSHRAAPRLAAAGAICLLCALGIAASIRPLLGTPVRQIHVDWRIGDARSRAALERQWRLSEGALVSGNRWSYVPLDTRAATLRAIAEHLAVAGTNGIDRHTYRLSSEGPLTARRGGRLLTASPVVAPLMKLAAGVLALAGIACLLLARMAARRLTPAAVLASLGAALAAALRPDARGRALALLQRGVPVASADAAGLFRIVFGSAVVAYIMSEPVSSVLLTPYELPRAAGLYGSLMRWLAAHPAVVDNLAVSVPVAGAFFIAGIATPVSYAAFVVAALVWASVASLGASHHVVSTLCVALVALVPARWGDGLGVDAWVRRRRGWMPPTASRVYGFAIWIPMFVFGVGFAAAAWSKLRAGPDWILYGSVKYHFLADFHQALVPWGLQLSAWPGVAVALSAAAVFVEVLVVTAAFSISPRYRAVCGVLALLMLSGFAVFQGVVWPGWWILLLGFLPWHQMRRQPAVPTAGGSLAVLQVVGVLLVAGQQLYASLERVEARPLVSAYDMYSTVYASPAAFEAASNLVYRLVGVTAGGVVELPGCTMDEPAARAFVRAAAGDAGERGRVRSLLRGCLDGRAEVGQVQIEGDREVFDWAARRFTWRRGLDRIGPFDAAWLRESGKHP